QDGELQQAAESVPALPAAAPIALPAVLEFEHAEFGDVGWVGDGGPVGVGDNDALRRGRALAEDVRGQEETQTEPELRTPKSIGDFNPTGEIEFEAPRPSHRRQRPLSSRALGSD